MTEPERVDALKIVTSVIARCERAQPKFAHGTSQHTLLKNRIQAMKIAQALWSEAVQSYIPRRIYLPLWSLWLPLSENVKRLGQNMNRTAGNMDDLTALSGPWSCPGH
jgi:hypothetical protein